MDFPCYGAFSRLWCSLSFSRTNVEIPRCPFGSRSASPHPGEGLMFLAGYIECPQLPQEGACEILTAGTRSVVSTFEIK